MSFRFYPKHEYGCEHVGHCPYLGGAALGALVRLASENQVSRQSLHRTIDVECKTVNAKMRDCFSSFSSLVGGSGAPICSPFGSFRRPNEEPVIRLAL